MNRSEFVALAVANTDNTSNVRISRNWDNSGVAHVADTVAQEFGRIVALLQAQIEKGQLCKKDEFLLIYNFQPIQTVEGNDYYSLDMLVKPTKEIEKIEHTGGVPLQLVVNGTTCEVMNNSQGMVEMGLSSDEELLQDGEEVPTILGNYNHYLALYDNKQETIQLEYNNEPIIAQQLFIKELLDMQNALAEQVIAHELAHNEPNINKPMFNSYRSKLTTFIKKEQEPQEIRTIHWSKSEDGTLFMFKSMSAKPSSSCGEEQTLDRRDNKDFPFDCMIRATA